MNDITRDEWLKALGESMAPPDPNAFTTQELADFFGVGTTSVKDRLRKLIREHKAIRVSKVVQDAAGRRVRLPAYKLVPHEVPRRKGR